MRLTRLTVAAVAALSASGVLAAVPSEAATCPSGFVCVYPQNNYQGKLTRYAQRDLVGGFSAGHGLGAFTTIAKSRSVLNRIGFTVEFATQEPKICLRAPCQQYRTSERIPNGVGKTALLETHNIVRRAP